MDNKETLEEVVVYSMGVIYCSVCAPKELSTKEIEEQVNEMHPTGLIDSKWRISEDPAFISGEANPHPCKNPARLHYLLNC